MVLLRLSAMNHRLQNIRQGLRQIILNRPPHSLDNKSRLRPQSNGGRFEIAKEIPRHAIGVELGVAGGYFSEALLVNSNLRRLFSIDRWGDHHDEREYVDCVARLAQFGDRSCVLRLDFNDAIHLFPDNYFDFIYIDAYAHTGQQDGKLLHDWWPKLKNGGVFSGHDYDPNWPKTILAVDDFAKVVDGEIETFPGIDTDDPSDGFASWLIRKTP